MPHTKNLNEKSPNDREGIKKKLLKHKLSFLRGIKRLTLFVAMQGAVTLPYAGNKLAQTKDAVSKDITALKKKAEAQKDSALWSREALLKNKITRRAAWLVEDNFIPAVKNRYEELRRLKGRAKLTYIKREFFDSVFKKGGIPGDANYCIAALMRCMADVNDKTGDLDDFIPDSQTLEGHNSVSCPRFVNYVKNKFPDCVTPYQRRIDLDKVEPGSILIIASKTNTSSGLHAKVYLGEGLEAGFNRDYLGKVKGVSSGYVINTKEIVEKCLTEKVKGAEYASALRLLESGMEENKAAETPRMPLTMAQNFRGGQSL